MAAFRTGQRVRAVGAIDYDAGCIVPGEVGTVLVVDQEEEGLEVQWDAHHPGLAGWANTTWLIEEDRDVLKHYAGPSVSLRATGLIVLGLLLLALPSPLYDLVFAAPKPPIVLSDMRAEPHTIKQGEPLRLAFMGTYTRACEFSIDRVISTAAEVSVWRERKYGIGQALSPTPVPRAVLIHLPGNLTPGDYIYRGTVHADCGAGDKTHTAQPEVPFTIQ